MRKISDKSSVPKDLSVVEVYTDGACSGNPGPMGIGTVTLGEDIYKEESKSLGTGTNNLAELTAILYGLRSAWLQLSKKNIDTTKWGVVIYSDSQYSIGVLAEGWKPKVNQILIHRILEYAQERFFQVYLIKVSGHSGVKYNERCDVLAKGAIK